jgi:hypothetical protein
MAYQQDAGISEGLVPVKQICPFLPVASALRVKGDDLQKGSVPLDVKLELTGRLGGCGINLHATHGADYPLALSVQFRLLGLGFRGYVEPQPSHAFGRVPVTVLCEMLCVSWEVTTYVAETLKNDDSGVCCCPHVA